MARSREHTIAFDHDERLWRRVEKRDLKGSALKADKLRLQVSVCRQKFTPNAEAVTFSKWNGVVESEAGKVALTESGIDVVCVDDPGVNGEGRQDAEGHALVAFTAKPGSAIGDEHVNAARAVVAASFRVIIEPT